jgi:hypothetical protein
MRQRRQPSRHLETTHARHRDVEHDRIGFLDEDGIECRLAVQHCAHDLEFAVELMTHTIEHGRMVVGEQNARSIHISGTLHPGDFRRYSVF